MIDLPIYVRERIRNTSIIFADEEKKVKL